MLFYSLKSYFDVWGVPEVIWLTFVVFIAPHSDLQLNQDLGLLLMMVVRRPNTCCVVQPPVHTSIEKTYFFTKDLSGNNLNLNGMISELLLDILTIVVS